MITGPDAPVDASVLIGSVNGGEWIHVLLDALSAQRGDVAFEVIVCDRCRDGTGERIARERPQVQLLRAEPTATLPELRALAFERARGRHVLVTEDHTVPPPEWLARFCAELDAAPGDVVAVGGPVDNAMCERAVDWAAFLCEYSGLLPPQSAGEVSDLPGMNVAYRRGAIAALDPALLRSGFWESTVHGRLREADYRFRFLPDVVIAHRKRFGFGHFLTQRYHYSRHFAGTRFGRAEAPKRLLFGVVSATLPVVLLARIARDVLPRPGYRAAFLRASPALACFVLSYAVGEAVGYFFGPGESLREIV